MSRFFKEVRHVHFFLLKTCGEGAFLRLFVVGRKKLACYLLDFDSLYRGICLFVRCNFLQRTFFMANSHAMLTAEEPEEGADPYR